MAGMQAREWISNSPEVVAATPETDRATELQITEGQEPVVRTLGIFWSSSEDTFAVATAKGSVGLLLTKRDVLRKVATTWVCQPICRQGKNSAAGVVVKGI